MEDKLYYIKGSKENPESVKQALLEVCPNAKVPRCLTFKNEIGIYYILDNVVYFSETWTKLIKRFGEELQPKKQEKVEFIEKVMYHRIYGLAKEESECHELFENDCLYPTIEEAMNDKFAVGYSEIKIMMKKD